TMGMQVSVFSNDERLWRWHHPTRPPETSHRHVHLLAVDLQPPGRPEGRPVPPHHTCLSLDLGFLDESGFICVLKRFLQRHILFVFPLLLKEFRFGVQSDRSSLAFLLA